MTASAAMATSAKALRGRDSRSTRAHSLANRGDSAGSRGAGSISAGSSRRVASAAVARPTMVNTASWRKPSTPENRKVT